MRINRCTIHSRRKNECFKESILASTSQCSNRVSQMTSYNGLSSGLWFINESCGCFTCEMWNKLDTWLCRIQLIRPTWRGESGVGKVCVWDGCRMWVSFSLFRNTLTCFPHGTTRSVRWDSLPMNWDVSTVLPSVHGFIDEGWTFRNISL